MEDTIAAISTALGVGAISIIRVSGKESLEIVNKIFKGKDLTKQPSHTIHYGHIVENDNIIDEVLVSIMKAPKTFTAEDTVEINAHGGIATTKKILELVIENGARLAQPGEFTKRAFLNGRIDLLEAEGVMDLIEAKTEQNRNLAINQVSGKVSNLIDELQDKMLDIQANIEVNIDYPEYEDIEVVTNEILKPKIDEILIEMKKILEQSNNGQLLKNGIKTVIVGKPNVGKSSLLNTLLEEEKAIVTNIAGTTRDIVEGNINLDGIVLNIIDTAGIRKTEDVVESIGVKKSLDYLNQADLILFVLDANEPITEEEQDLFENIKNKKHITIINKMDLNPNFEFNKEECVYLSTLENKGIDDLKQKIKDLFHANEIETKDLTYLTNARAIALLKQAIQNVEDAKKAIETNMPIDMVEIDIKQAWEKLGEIIGKTYQEELLDKLFSQFCLGK